MKLYFAAQDSKPDSGEILRTLRKTLEERSPGFQADPVFSLAYDRDNQFFLKGPEGILWGRVFYEALSQGQADILRGELEHLFQTFTQKVIPYVFFPAVREGIAELLERMPGHPNFYQYSILQSEQGKGLVLHPWSQRLQRKNAGSGKAGIEVLLPENARGITPKTIWRLKREELAELIDLGIALRKVSLGSPVAG